MPILAFSDIGKPTKDLLSKDFPVGLANLEIKTTSLSGLNFSVTGSQDFKSNLLKAELKTKYNEKTNGITFTETFDTDNLLTGQVEFQDALVRGLKLDVKGSIVPSGE
jgi:voltage-dependent anion channel protein 2